MQDIFKKWRGFLNEKKVLKEMQWIDSTFLPEKFIDGLPERVKNNIVSHGVLDFAFERYKEVFQDSQMGTGPLKFFAPYGEGQEQFFDFSHPEEEAAREPSEEDKIQRGKTIPVLRKDWYNSFLTRIKPNIVKEQKDKEKRNLAIVKTLAVFDFDDTLFKSTEASKRLGTDSHLSPDSIPDKAKESDWNLEVVYKAQELCSNPNIYCVMMTGRIGNIFEDKINTLLNDKNIFFAETHFNEFGGDTVEYKTKTIYRIIDKLPNVKQLIMWEDQEDKAEDYTEEFTDKLSFNIHMVGQEKDK